MRLARNVAIIVGFALIVWLVPGGGTTAGLLSGLLSATFMALIALFGGRLYQRFRGEIFGLGDRYRALLYGAVAAGAVMLAATRRLFETGAGTLLWLAVLGGCIWALVMVWRHWRAYQF